MKPPSPVSGCPGPAWVGRYAGLAGLGPGVAAALGAAHAPVQV